MRDSKYPYIWISSSVLTFYLQLREERKQAIEEHVQAVHQILREAEKAGTEGKIQTGDSDDEEWNGLDDDNVQEAPIDMEEEYIDEDRYTTVTVEAVSVDRGGLHKPGAQPNGEVNDTAPKEATEEEDTEKGSGKKEWPKKKKKKSFRYGTKDERRATERQQKAKRDRR